ncbi:MAG: sigma-70 family RNA polymerase sigma factor, partial [Planctomycetes bacterium]|nr:sigma-70 family RNA polymerase sigma factor [Planctomycetota bacterium]
VTFMFLGGNDLFPIAGAKCCGRPWVRGYVRRTRRLIRIYGRTIWMTLPAPRDRGLARGFRRVNRAVRRGPDLPTESETLESNCVETATPLALVLEGERRTQVRAGLARLRALDRATLVAFYVNGKSLIEMADEFDAPVGTIKRRLHVARKRLAKEVDGLMAV